MLTINGRPIAFQESPTPSLVQEGETIGQLGSADHSACGVWLLN
jgi:hypothetical protein